MAKSKRRYTSGGPARPESPRRSMTPSAPPPTAQQPPAGARPVPAIRPLTPERTSRGGLLGAFGAQRLIVAVSAVVVIAALGLLMFAWYDSNIKPRRETAVSAGSRAYSMEYFAKRFRQAAEDPANAAAVRSGFLTTLPNRIAEQMADEAVVLQRAGSLGIEAGQNEIDRDMLVRLGVPVVTDTPEGAEVGPDDSFTVTPFMQQTIRTQLQRFGYTLEQYRSAVHAQLLRQKVEDSFREKAPARGPQARIRLLQLPNEADAQKAIQFIKSGERSFEQIAEESSLDRAGKGKGGERDWLPRGILPESVEKAAFSLPLRTLSEPIDAGGDNLWIVLEVLERTDERDITDDAKRQIAAKGFNDWLTKERETLGVKNELTESRIRFAVKWAGITPPQSPTQNRPGLPSGIQNPPVQPQPGPSVAPAESPPVSPPSSP